MACRWLELIRTCDHGQFTETSIDGNRIKSFRTYVTLISTDISPRHMHSPTHSPSPSASRPASPNFQTASSLTAICPSLLNCTPSHRNMRIFSFCNGPIPPPLNGLCQFFPPAPPTTTDDSDDSHSPLKPPTKRLDAMTRWQGIRGANGLLRRAPPTERGEPLPSALHTSL